MRAKPKKINLTKAAIEGIKAPESGRIYVYDAKTAGLAVCITSAGSKTFYVYRKVDGRPERIKIGPWPDMTIEQARKHADRHNGLIADGKNPNDQRRANRSAQTFAEAFGEYLEQPTRTRSKRPKSANTVHNYKLQFRLYLEQTLGSLKVTKIKRRDIERIQDNLATTVGNHTANRALSLIVAVLNYSVDQGYLEANPASRLRKYTEESRDRFIEAEEFPKFWQALEAEPNEKLRDYFKICLFTGQRRGNVLSMKWVDVNLGSATWTIPKTKTGKHSVPLTAAAIDILKSRKANAGDSEYVFPSRQHGCGHLVEPTPVWRSILKRAGIENLRIHDLRRSMGSWQAITGSSLTVIGKTLGHSQAQTTAVYARLSSDPVLASMETATAAMMNAAKPPEGNGNGKA